MESVLTEIKKEINSRFWVIKFPIPGIESISLDLNGVGEDGKEPVPYAWRHDIGGLAKKMWIEDGFYHVIGHNDQMISINSNEIVMLMND